MKTSVNIKMDVEDRDAAKKLFDSLGLDMTTAVNLFVKASLREKAIPFQIAAEQSEAIRCLEQAIEPEGKARAAN